MPHVPKSDTASIPVLTFGEGCSWMYSTPQSLESFKWSRISADGMTPMGEAFLELNKKMSRDAFLAAPHLSFAPVVFLLTDGYPTDDAYGALEKLRATPREKGGVQLLPSSLLALGTSCLTPSPPPREEQPFSVSTGLTFRNNQTRREHPPTPLIYSNQA